MKNRKLHEKVKGFTLIELMIVIAIIGILVTIVVIAVNPRRLIQDANDSKKRQEFTQLKNSLQLYHNDFNAYPAAAAALVPDYTRALPASFAAGKAIYVNTPTGEYRAGVDLDNPSAAGNDDNTFTKCNQPAGSIPVGGLWNTADYFVCPD